MALSKTESTKSYVATGLTTFEFNIPYFNSSDLVVKRQNANGTVTTLSQTATPANADQYSVTASGNDTENGATITLGGASTSGLTYTIERVVPYTQQYDLQEGATIDPTALNKALDRTVAQNQQQQSVFDRTLVFPITDASTITYDVGTVTQRAGKALGFDTNGNVTQIDLASSNVISANIQEGVSLTDGGVLSAKVDNTTTQFSSGNIAVKTIDTAQLAASAVETAKINDSAVTTAKIADANVTEAKLASNAVTSGKISSGSVTEAKLVNDSVTSAKIASLAVGTTEIADDAVTNAKIGASAVGTTEIADNAVTYAKLQNISTDTVLGRLSAGTGAVESITVDEDISSVSANHDTLASAKAIKDYVDTSAILPNIAIGRKTGLQLISNTSNHTWYTILNLAPVLTINRTNSIYKITADINFGANTFEELIGFKVMYSLNGGSYTDFDLNTQGSRFSVHSGFNGYDGASGGAMAGHSFNVYLPAVGGISVGDTLTFQLYIGGSTGAGSNDFYINRGYNESAFDSNEYLTGKTVLAAEEIYQ